MSLNYWNKWTFHDILIYWDAPVNSMQGPGDVFFKVSNLSLSYKCEDDFGLNVYMVQQLKNSRLLGLFDGIKINVHRLSVQWF